jgi:predicted DNA-binding protein (UPF0251 family)
LETISRPKGQETKQPNNVQDGILSSSSANSQSSPPIIPEKRKAKRRRRARNNQITARQLEAAQLFGEHKGNFAAGAKAMGISRTAFIKLYSKACKKLGKSAVTNKTSTVMLRADKRGQIDIGNGDDRRLS